MLTFILKSYFTKETTTIPTEKYLREIIKATAKITIRKNLKHKFYVWHWNVSPP